LNSRQRMEQQTEDGTADKGWNNRHWMERHVEDGTAGRGWYIMDETAGRGLNNRKAGREWKRKVEHGTAGSDCKSRQNIYMYIG
jgi:hypothetical protein